MPLKVLIVGAGIAGLAAAIALARQGHAMYLFEKSAFSNEVGAALHFGPHAVRVLRAWNMDLDSLRPCICLAWQKTDLEGKVTAVKFDLRKKQQELGVVEDEIMIHRVDAHACLREHALSFPNVQLHLASGVASVDAEEGSITLVDGTTHRGDIVVGADGVHSRTVRAIAGDACVPRRIGVNMYRFMVSTDRARSDPIVGGFLDSSGFPTIHNQVIETGDRHRWMVLYSCRGGSLINMATFQPAAIEKVALTSDWTNPGTIDDVVELMEGWPEHFQRLFRMAEDVKHWAVVGREVAQTFVKGRLVLIGDAAHPTQPTHGAGAGMGIEDAAVLGVVLDETVNAENLAGRLKLFNKLRYERSVTIKYASEMLGPEGPDTRKKQEKILRTYVDEGQIPLDAEAYMWPLDVVAEAKLAMDQM